MKFREFQKPHSGIYAFQHFHVHFLLLFNLRAADVGDGIQRQQYTFRAKNGLLGWDSLNGGTISSDSVFPVGWLACCANFLHRNAKRRRDVCHTLGLRVFQGSQTGLIACETRSKSYRCRHQHSDKI